MRQAVVLMSFSFKPDYKKILNKKDITKMFWRSIPYEHSWNYERMGNVGFTWALLPILKKLYPQNKEKERPGLVNGA